MGLEAWRGCTKAASLAASFTSANKLFLAMRILTVVDA